MVIDTVKGFGIVNKAEIDVFLELSWSATYSLQARFTTGLTSTIYDGLG